MIVKNYLYNLMYQLLTIILPIVTIPYISRVLGAEGLGKYSLTNAYAQYFVLFGMVGLATYCSREVAYVRNDKVKLSKIFWELNFLRFITMGISIIMYTLFCLYIIKSENKMISIIQGLILLSSLFDISWLFIGIEDFKKVSIRNTIVKLLGVCLIFMFVKNKSQVWLYTLILGGTQLLGQIIMWLDIPKEINFFMPKKDEIKKHLLFSLKLFIPQLAINVYCMLDKIMLGTLVNEVEVGMYDNAQKIIRIVLTIATSLATVMTPNMINLYVNGEMNKFSKKIYQSFSFVSFLTFPMVFGLIGICKNFIPWFYGPGFAGIENIFYLGSWIMIAVGWASVIGVQVLISIKRENQYTIAVTISAVINFILNLVLIKKLDGIGATISTVVAEFTGISIILYFARDIVNIKKLFINVPKYLISSVVMFLIIFNLGKLVNPTIIGTIIQVIVGIVSYISIMIIIKDENLFYIINFIKNKMKSKKVSETLA